jgi:DNA-binding transcriptional ArsR family regulator
MAAVRPLEILREPERARALLDPERARVLRALHERPDSAAGLARRFGEGRQRLNYHLGRLEDAGIIELHEERRRRGQVERVLRPVARAFVVDPGALGELAGAPEQTGDRFSATYLIAVAARVIRELAALSARATSQRKRLAAATIDAQVTLAEPADFTAFVDDLTSAVADVVARHHAASGRAFRVVAASYQRPADADRATAGAASNES